MCREFPTIPTCLRLNNLSKPPMSKMKISQKVYIYFMWMVLTSEVPVKSCRVHLNLIKLDLHSSWHGKTLHNFFFFSKDYVYTKQKRCYTDWKSCQKVYFWDFKCSIKSHSHGFMRSIKYRFTKKVLLLNIAGKKIKSWTGFERKLLIGKNSIPRNMKETMHSKES